MTIEMYYVKRLLTAGLLFVITACTNNAADEVQTGTDQPSTRMDSGQVRQQAIKSDTLGKEKDGTRSNH